MVERRLECVFEGICHLGECPVWNPRERRLYWTDVFNRRLWVHDPADGSSRVFWEGPVQVGGFAFTRGNAMVLCAEHGVWLLDRTSSGVPRGPARRIMDIPMHADEAFNDITTDPVGRIFAGTVRRGGEAGCLYRLEKGKSPEKVLGGVYCSNGMTFSLDEKTFYHTNTGLRRVTAYDYDRETGRIGNPRTFSQGTEREGLPDGLTLDAEGHLWQAFWGVGAVRRFSPEGDVVEEIAVPAKQPSSVMFGGERLDHLYITTACQGAADLATGTDAGGTFLGGKVYRCRLPVNGRAEWPAEFSS